MKAVQFSGVDELSLADVEPPRIGPDEVLVALRSVGICHSDFELLEGRYIIPFEYPLIPGHEWSGAVVEVGRDVTGFRPGDRVLGECVIGNEHFGFSISGAAA
jgi:L-iditol 2-dehydrogenase